jgi:hypothetical protein
MWNKKKGNGISYEIVSYKTSPQENASIANQSEQINIDGIKDEQELVEAINTACETLDDLIKNIFLEIDVVRDCIYELESENYNKLTPNNRALIFAKINAYACASMGKDTLKVEVLLSDAPYNGEEIAFEDNHCIIDKELFQHKNCGIILLTNYLKEFRKYMYMQIIDVAYESGIDPRKLKGKAKIYYENMSESCLNHSWHNLLKKEDKDYGFQPLILDSNVLSYNIIFEIMKDLFKKNHTFDREMSDLAYSYMDFFAKLDFLKANRKRVIANNHKNILGYKKDLDMHLKYLTRTVEDYSKFSDDEVFELLNSSYYNALNTNDDGKLELRLTKLTHEILVRTFSGFDLTNVEFPKYEFNFDKENQEMTLKRIYDGEINEYEVADSSEIFCLLVSDISYVAQSYDLFKFNSEEEKQDYYTMKEWCNLKRVKGTSEKDQEVIGDGLNIILRKVYELLSDLDEKINSAIAKSSFTPHSKSMLAFNSKDANYDYHEFKNGYSKDQVTASLMDYIKADLENNKKNGGR